MGENPDFIFNIGSPEVDIMSRKDLPTIEEVKKRYAINFERFSICILHPVTTERHLTLEQSNALIEALVKSQKNYLVILPNNDSGSADILRAYERIKNNQHFRILPSMRFEYYLCALKNSEFIIGNSSSGVREAPYYGVPTVNLGTRQRGRSKAPTIVDSDFNAENILKSINFAKGAAKKETSFFGDGNAGLNFTKTLKLKEVWNHPIQKIFVDSESIS
jgi:UDP-N-acetylglucosamine 2-epimerase (hydrolysing)